MGSAQTALGGIGQPNMDPTGTCASGVPGSGLGATVPSAPGTAHQAPAQMTDLGPSPGISYGGVAGQPGQPGTPGQGGGGGGGAMSGTFCGSPASPVDGPGASGGGGGAGGCGGLGGGGGKAGGSSIAIVSLGTKLTLTGVTLTVGTAGKGGSGTLGQGGGAVGAGAFGGAASGIAGSNPGCNGGARWCRAAAVAPAAVDGAGTRSASRTRRRRAIDEGRDVHEGQPRRRGTRRQRRADMGNGAPGNAGDVQGLR